MTVASQPLTLALSLLRSGRATSNIRPGSSAAGSRTAAAGATAA